MKEFLELRVMEPYATQVFGPDAGKRSRIMSVCRITVPSVDRRLAVLAAILQSEREKPSGDLVCGSWRFIRRYSEAEIAAAELFQFRITAVFEPAGAECGTVYSSNGACPICGAGRTTEQLRLNLRKVRKKADIAMTIADDEWIVNERVVKLFRKHHLTGAEFRQVADTSRRHSGEERPKWYQLLVTSTPVILSSRSRFGESPIEHMNEFICPRGDTVGDQLITRAFVSAA